MNFHFTYILDYDMIFCNRIHYQAFPSEKNNVVENFSTEKTNHPPKLPNSEVPLNSFSRTHIINGRNEMTL